MPADSISTGFCRDCLKAVADHDERCRNCHSRRLARHPELHALPIAHIDCDAFYASVEKRDNPELKDKPVIVGGGVRGVVSTACYIARIHGVKSAMPMFKALKLCPDAVVIKPNMKKYSDVGHEVRALMEKLTPLVEPLSIDEAFLDLSGTERLHGRSPALSLAALLRDIEEQLGITASAGLSYNKYLAKVASDLEKPKGFSIIGKQAAKAFLAGQSVRLIWGVGAAFQKQLQQDGITTIGQLQEMDRAILMKRYGIMGARLYHLSRGEDVRNVSSHEASKSISSETTFNTDISEFERLEAILWRLAERVSERAKAEGMAGRTVTLKLKTADFRLQTRSAGLEDATNLAHTIFTAAQPLLRKEANGTRYRLVGVGISNLVEDEIAAGPALDSRYRALTEAERAMDKLRHKFGSAAIGKGRALRSADD